MFIDRHLAYRETSRLLDSLLSTQVGRIHKFQRIVEIGYDAKDCLLQHLAVDENAEDVLARRSVPRKEAVQALIPVLPGIIVMLL